MSYRFEPDRLYRAPTHFGPAPGPRQRPDGGRWANLDRPHVLTAWLTVRVSGAELERHMPPGFGPHPDPRMFVEVRELGELDWLAGRGYNILHVSFAALHRASGRSGRLSACVFESRADPIITGRDELGIPKMYAEVTPLTVADGRLSASAAWDGFRFFELEIDGLEPGEAGPEGPGGAPYLHYRYVPRVGSPGEADAEYVVFGGVDEGRARVLSNHRGRGGRMRFVPGRFEDLPTLVHIVDGLAAIGAHEMVGAGLVETRGRSDHRNLSVLRGSAKS